MDGKRRQYVPPALQGPPAPTPIANAAVAAAETSGKRLISLRSSALPPESSLPTHSSQSAQAGSEEATTGMSRSTTYTSSEGLAAFAPSPKGDAPLRSVTTATTASAATGLLRTHRDDSLPFPRPRSYAAPPLASSTASSIAPASAAAAAAAATLLKIRNQTSNCSTAGVAPLSEPSSSERISLSSLRQVATRSPPEGQQRPLSTVPFASSLTGEGHKPRLVTIASANHSLKAVPSSSPPTPSPFDGPHSALELCREALGLGGDETRCNDAVGLTPVGQKNFKRPRHCAFSPISDDDDDDVYDRGDASSSRSSSSCLADKESVPSFLSSGVAADPPRVLAGGGEDTTQAGEGSSSVLAAYRTATPTGLLLRPGREDLGTAPQVQHPLDHASSPPPTFPPPDSITGASNEDVEQTPLDLDTEEGGNTDTDNETGEDDGARGRRSVVPSDPLRFAVDLAHVRMIAARATTKSAPVISGEDAVHRSEEEEAMLACTQDESELHPHAKQTSTTSYSLCTDRDTREAVSARALLEKRAKADIHRRATQAATAPAPRSELLLSLLQHLPTAPGRAIYDQSGCPSSAAGSGFDEEFHKCVQRFTTRIVLQRDGRIGDVQLPPVSPAPAALPPQQVRAVSGRCSDTQRRGANEKRKVVEVEGAVEVLSRGLSTDVRDVVAYAQCVMQERLSQEQQQKSKSHSSASKMAVEKTERCQHADDEVCVQGDVLDSNKREQLAELQAVVDQKLSLMRATVDDTRETPVASNATSTDSKEMLVAAHKRFTDVVRRAAASRREKAEAAQVAEQRLEATVDAWRKSYDMLLKRELDRHRVAQRTERRPRMEAPLQALQPPQEEHKKARHHQSPTGLWDTPRGMRRKERKRLKKLVKAANACSMPPFQ
ncbi:hypothetical protein JKF63_00214 [Porcisia hertigi]|uniref:Uncharacterized protein n=1 Tax=Porcisia hertigi TaxID=2761500 RepID=A0A836HT83_9TRYP|nr:hypothetical protein JKF63_00214 [Porcisia hertigi]